MTNYTEPLVTISLKEYNDLQKAKTDNNNGLLVAKTILCEFVNSAMKNYVGRGLPDNTHVILRNIADRGIVTSWRNKEAAVQVLRPEDIDITLIDKTKK